jgi:uncharacterized repeat protein (TIGR03803 family)
LEGNIVNVRSIGIFALAASLAACSNAGGSLPGAIPGNASRTVAQSRVAPSNTFAALYAFKGPPDGAYPLAPLLHVGGRLYGTTSQGGTATANGDGAIFEVGLNGTEKVLYSFAGSPDGEFPQAGLLAIKGTLYGTTPNGGETGNGTVFTSTKTGVEHAAYSFMGTSDGTSPASSLIDVAGTLYGTTLGGGGANCNSNFGCGTVFKIDPSGAETVLYRFQGGTDGATPSANLTYYHGMLYGTTFFGGGSSCNFRGCGTVYKINPAGVESIVYSFKGGSDGSNPSAGVIDVRGTFYGTTSSGGGNRDDGTVFAVNRSGKERVIHKFTGTHDGADPEAGLLAIGSTLYGTTYSGGSEDFGTAFKMDTNGAEAVLYSFANGADGANPSASLIQVKNKLYGTAKNGGAGYGTVFSLDL